MNICLIPLRGTNIPFSSISPSPMILRVGSLIMGEINLIWAESEKRNNGFSNLTTG